MEIGSRTRAKAAAEEAAVEVAGCSRGRDTATAHVVRWRRAAWTAQPGPFLLGFPPPGGNFLLTSPTYHRPTTTDIKEK
ncbi:unnamed protein product [Sphagnum balticum]